MIRTITGTISHLMPDGVVVDVGGVGYLVAVPARSLPHVGEHVDLFTFHYIREDLQALYGFARAPENQMFQALLTVPSIGPKLAMGILSAATPADITSAVATDNIGFFAALPGVGRKSAANIIIQLKGKLIAGGDVTIPEGGTALVEALTTLGYAPAEIQPLVARLPSELQGPEAQVSWALKQLS